jgi:ribosomal-protein-alanine N-acetyltransferase
MIEEMSRPEKVTGIPPGDQVTLRPVRPEDAEIISVFKRDPLVRKMALGPGPLSTPEEELQQILAAIASDREEYFVIVDRSDDRPVGYVRINWMDSEHEFAWLRFALGERRHRGLARDALAALLSHFFATGVHRVDAEVDTANERSLSLLDGLGFRREGVKLEACASEDGYSDYVVYGLLEKDLTVQ